MDKRFSEIVIQRWRFYLTVASLICLSYERTEMYVVLSLAGWPLSWCQESAGSFIYRRKSS